MHEYDVEVIYDTHEKRGKGLTYTTRTRSTELAAFAAGKFFAETFPQVARVTEVNVTEVKGRH